MVLHRLAGEEAAGRVLRERAGGAYDPDVATRLAADAERLLGQVPTSTWDAVIEAEPGPRPTLANEALDRALRAIADFADLKSPYTSGHSSGVAELADQAARAARLPHEDVDDLRRAALVHDLGRTGVPNGIWDRPGPLSDAEWERVRLHPYFAERMLARPAPLARLGALAALHHERLDGTGYHRGARASALPLSARILAAADVYHALTELRPHRPAFPPAEAADVVRAEVRAGRLDGEAAAFVLGAAGHRVRRRREWPAGLTGREVEVLRLLARGLGKTADDSALARAYGRVSTDQEDAMDEVLAVFTVEGETARLLEAYDRALPALQAAAGEIGSPRVHVCAPSESGLTIVDVWESGEALERFSEHPRFREIIHGAGLPDPSAVTVSPVHAIGWPAAAPQPV